MLEPSLLILAAMIVGISKGGLSSVGSIAVPMLALFMNPLTAAATLLPVYIVTDWVSVWLYRRDFSRPNVAILVSGMLIGIAIATIITPWTSESLLLIFTGLIGLWYTARSWMQRNLVIAKTEPRWGIGLFWGTLTGITSFLTHSGAPPAQAYLLPQRLAKLEFAGTIALSFAVCNATKIPAYWAIGQFEGLSWSLVAGLTVAGIVGTFIGRRLTEILPEAVYMKVIKSMLFILSIVLIWRGVTDLI